MQEINTLFAATHGRGRPGRKTASYASNILNLLRDTDNDLKPEAITSLSQDRIDWRKMCKNDDYLNI